MSRSVVFLFSISITALYKVCSLPC